MNRQAAKRARALAIIALAATELPFLAFLYDPLAVNDESSLWLQVRAVLREGVPTALFFMAALAIIAAPRWNDIGATWREAAGAHRWQAPLAVNIALFAALAVLTPAFNAYGAGLAEPPWALFLLWTAAIGTAYAMLALAFAPLAFWRDILRKERTLIALSGAAALLIQSAAILSRESWNALSEATFRLSTALLRLYESDVVSIPDERIIGIGGFKVNIAAACSGYEGVGLVTVFLAIYLWIFRSVLKFPNVLAILPIGVGAIWILNSVRIAALVSLGAHVSPEVAVAGFHSQAGWIMFLLVTIAIMVATHRVAAFHDGAAIYHRNAPSPAFEEAAALLAPFLAMTAAGILAAAFSATGERLYGLRVGAGLLALFAFWRFYRAFDWRVGLLPIFLGFAVGAAWIATDAGGAGPGAWLVQLPPAERNAWLTLRIAGMALLAPFAEELVFRGYLHRKLIAERFEEVAPAAFSWKAFLITSALFGAIHERWLSGALAGAVFAFALYRSGKVEGAIAAHMTANAVIAVWAVIFRQWGLL